MITEEQLNNFIKIYKNLNGVELDRHEALMMAQKLLNLMQICLESDSI